MFDVWSINIYLIYSGVLAVSVAALIVSDVNLSGLFWGIGFIGGIAFGGLLYSWLDKYL